MTVDLIPQDRLTLELLAKVLAKMYRYSLNSEKISRDDAPIETAESGPGESSADHKGLLYDHTIPERVLAQVEIA